MRQDQDVQYMLLSIRCLMNSDRMRTDAISESMIQVLYNIVVQCNSGAVINSRQNMYNIVLDYNENSTAQYMYKQAVIHTKLSNRLYPIQYISQHDTARQYRTCIMDSDMASVLIRSLCIKHLILNNMYCIYVLVLSHVVLCNPYIPGPLLSCKFVKNLLIPFLFLLLLTIAIIRMNVQTGI